MARVAGLTPQEQTGQGGKITADSRAPIAANRPAPDLSPRAAPVSVYAPPEDNTQAAGSDLRQLAAALGNINPALRNFAGEYTDEAQKQQEAAAANKIGGMTFDEAQKGVQEGTIGEMQNPWFKAAFMKQFGQRVALRKSQELAEKYSNGFDKENGNVEQLVADTAKPVIEQYGNDRHFSAGFNNVFTPNAAKVKNEQSAHQSARVNTEVRQGVYEIGTALITQGIEQGKSADGIVADLRSTYAGNKQLLNVPYAEQDAAVLRMATTLAQGISTAKNPKLQKEIVEKLLSDDRVAPDGHKLGSLANNQQYADKAVKLLDASDKELRERNKRDSFFGHASWFEEAQQGLITDKRYQELVDEHQSNPGRYTDSAVISLKARSDAVLEHRRNEAAVLGEKVRNRQLADGQHNAVMNDAYTLAGQGQLWALKDTEVLDEHGNKKTMKADATAEQITKGWLQTNAAAGGPDAFSRAARWLASNNQVNPEWSNVLEAGYMQANSVSLSGNKLPSNLEAGFKVYEQLYAENPQLLKRHIKDDAMNVYEAMRLGKEMHIPPGQAAINALEINKDPTKYESPSWKKKFEDINSAVKNLKYDGDWFATAGSNAGELSVAVEKAAMYYSKIGASQDEAIRQAKKQVIMNYAPVNGALVHTGDRGIPTSFPQMAENYLKDYAEKYGAKEGISASDLTVRSVGNAAGQWQIVLKNNIAMGVDHPEGKFDLAQLNEFEKGRVEKEREAARVRVNDKKERDLQNLYQHFDREEYVLTNEAAGIGKVDRERREKALADFRKTHGKKAPEPTATSRPASSPYDMGLAVPLP